MNRLILFFTVVFSILLFPQVLALEEIHYQSDGTTATFTEIYHTNPLLWEPSPKQKPSQPFDWTKTTVTLDRRLLKVEKPSGTLLKVFYRNDNQVKNLIDYEHKIMVNFHYDTNDILTHYEYVDFQNRPIQHEYVQTEAYAGNDPFLLGSLLRTHTFELLDRNDIGILDYKEYYRLFPSTSPNLPANTDVSSLIYYNVYRRNGALTKVVDRIEYFQNNQKKETHYSVHNEQGLLQQVYGLDHVNRVLFFLSFSYIPCNTRDNVIDRVFILDENGGRIARYVYDNKDPCKPWATLLRIVDEKTGQDLYSLSYSY